jgi:hypothetical protein
VTLCLPAQEGCSHGSTELLDHHQLTGMPLSPNARASATTPAGCLWLLGALILLPIIHYIFAGVIILLAIASFPYCLRLVKVIELRNSLRPRLVNTFFVTDDSCGKIEGVEANYICLWPRLRIDIFSCPLADPSLSLRCSLALENLSCFKTMDQSRWPALAAKSLGLTLQTDISPEAKAIDLLVRIVAMLESSTTKLNSLDKKISELAASVRLCAGNPLLEPSLDNIKKMLAEAKQIRSRTWAETESVEAKALTLRDFLSLPQSVRTHLASGLNLEDGISGENLEADFNELTELVRIMDDLIDGRV